MHPGTLPIILTMLLFVLPMSMSLAFYVVAKREQWADDEAFEQWAKMEEQKIEQRRNQQ